MDKLIIVGAGGHGKVIADIARRLDRYCEIKFLDDNYNIEKCLNCRVVGATSDVKIFKSTHEVFIAVGNNEKRKNIAEWLLKQNVKIATLVHPTAVIAEAVRIGIGTAIMGGVVINPDTYIGNYAVINTGSTVDHDCYIDAYAHVAIGARVAGGVRVGKGTWIGAGAIISNNIIICSDCMIGAGAVVVKDIEQKGTYVGIPARRVSCK